MNDTERGKLFALLDDCASGIDGAAVNPRLMCDVCVVILCEWSFNDHVLSFEPTASDVAEWRVARDCTAPATCVNHD